MRRRVKRGSRREREWERQRGGRGREGGSADLGEDVWEAVTLESCITKTMITSKGVQVIPDVRSDTAASSKGSLERWLKISYFTNHLVIYRILEELCTVLQVYPKAKTFILQNSLQNQLHIAKVQFQVVVYLFYSVKTQKSSAKSTTYFPQETCLCTKCLQYSGPIPRGSLNRHVRH